MIALVFVVACLLVGVVWLARIGWHFAGIFIGGSVIGGCFGWVLTVVVMTR